MDGFNYDNYENNDNSSTVYVGDPNTLPSIWMDSTVLINGDDDNNN